MLQERRAEGIRFFASFVAAAAEAPDRPRPTASLDILAPLLGPDVARAIAAALPALAELRLVGRGRSETAEDVGEGLAVLLCGGGEGDGGGGGDRGGHGTGSGGCPGAVDESSRLPPGRPPPTPLPLLTCVRLYGALELSPGLTAALRGCARLRELDVAGAVWHAAVAARLAQLTQLRALTLGACELGLLPCLLPPLRGLTRLDLRLSAGLLCADRLAALTDLADLQLPAVRLDVRGLAALTALTALTVRSLLPPGAAGAPPPGEGGGGGGEGGSGSEGYPLPPRLCVLALGEAEQPELLAALRPPACLTALRLAAGLLTFRLAAGAHSLADGSMRAEAEGALVGAAALLAARAPRREALCVVYRGASEEPGRRLLRPVSGAGAPGGRQHGAWLAALGGLRLKRLYLMGLSLAEADLRAVALHLTSLQELSIGNPADFAVCAVPLLAGLPGLQLLELGVDHWCGGGEAAAALRAEALGPLGALLCGGLEGGRRFSGQLRLRVWEYGPGEMDAAQGLMVRLRERVEGAGSDPDRVQLAGAR